MHHGSFTHLSGGRVGAIGTHGDAGDVISMRVEEQLLVFGQIVHNTEAGGGIDDGGRIDEIRIVPI